MNQMVFQEVQLSDLLSKYLNESLRDLKRFLVQAVLCVHACVCVQSI